LGEVRVVGVAVLRADADGRRLLAARRRPGPGQGGGWELPGGKCEVDESLEQGAVREIHEELGCTITVTGRLSGSEPVRPGWTLQVVTAELSAGEPRALEHAELRWLAAGELDSVDWLPADVPFLAALQAHLAPDVGG
jgi:8-oxo-dGTP diphosphatase